MELFSRRLAEELAARGPCVVVANQLGKRGLPLFLPYALIATALKARRHRVDCIHLGDALLAPMGLALKRLAGVPVTVSVHGLDVTYRNAFYQRAVGMALPRLDHVVAVSESTKAICIERWPQLADKTSVVPNGVDRPDVAPTSELKWFKNLTEGKRVLLSVGRLVERKGVAWFVRQVLPRLPQDVILVVAGEGSHRREIEAAILETAMQDRVHLLGRVDNATLEALYARADAFVMPNVVVDGDVEGFGLVASESAIRGLPVLAANLQGIPEAIHHERNGLLLPAEDAPAWVAAVSNLLVMTPTEYRQMGSRVQQYTADVFSWQRSAARYIECFQRVCGGPAVDGFAPAVAEEAA
jgi:phosphatidylinositol alpha-1,6-mannosyltransferase